MNKFLKSVKEFHEAFNIPVENEILDDNKDIRDLRLALIFEEMVELATAMGCTDKLKDLISKLEIEETTNYDKKETLDALCDISYILSGTILSLGYTDVFENAFDDVHKSNMSKACNNMTEAKDTISHYKKERGEPLKLSIQEKGDKYLVIREDGKVMKNINYNEVKLDKYIQ